MQNEVLESGRCIKYTLQRRSLALQFSRSGTKHERTSLKYKSTFSGLRHHSTCFCSVYFIQLGYRKGEVALLFDAKVY